MTGLKSHRMRLALAGTVLGSLALSACGSSESTSAASSVDCETTEKATIVLGTPDLDVSYIPYGILAEELGYFDEECLDVTIESAAKVLPSMLTSGKADMMTATPETLIMASDSEPFDVAFMHNFMPSLNIFLAVPEGSDITDAGDLKGATIGTSGANPLYDAFLTESLEPHGLKLTDVTQIETGYGITPMKALETGEVDAILYWPGILTSWEEAGHDLRWLDAEWSEAYDGFGFIASNDFITSSPAAVEGISRGLAKSAVYLQRFPENAVKKFWAAYPERAPLPGADEAEKMAEDLAILNSTLKSMKADEYEADHTWGIQTMDRWTGHVAFDKANGMITGDPDPAQFFYADHVEAANDFDRDAIVEVE